MTITAGPALPETIPAHPTPLVRSGHRWALGLLLGGTALLYLWDLGRSGWANSFYSAAAQAGSQSWKAFLFGSSDAANSITVDKPPLSLWLPASGIRVFGLNAWAILVPQALMGVAAVALIWDAVRRPFGEAAGLIAGLVLTLTPVAVTIFRYNNPDALLVLLMIAAVWAMMRALDDGRLRWLLLCGGCLGLGYLTKQLEVALVMPALGMVFLVAGPGSLPARTGRLVLAALAALATAGWWVLLVQLWPASRRPWIGGTQTNSILELTLRYNGFGRLNGDEPGSTGAPGFAGPGFGHLPAHPWGRPGIGRLLEPAQAGGIGWLLPGALIFVAALLIWRLRAPRHDLPRAAVLIWTLWLLTTALVFSFMAGIFHPYYTVALAPPVAAVIGIGTTVCWVHRRRAWARTALIVSVVATAATSISILGQHPGYQPALRPLVAIAGAALLCLLTTRWASDRTVRHLIPVLAAVVALSGPVAFSLTTVGRGNSGSLPIAGPVMRPVTAMTKGVPQARRAEVTVVNGVGHGPHLVGCTLLDSAVPDRAVVDLLAAGADSYTWVGATVGSVCAAGYQLATGHPVLPVGGFNGTDPAPAPDQFMRLVLAGRIHYFIVTNPIREDRWGHLDTNALIQQWVQRNFTPERVGRVEIYDLTK